MVRIPPEFDPPYESPVEEQFAWSVVKLLDPRCGFQKQFVINTQRGRFRLDFLLTTPRGLRIGIEIDGAGFHQHRNDSWRDALLLGELHADVVLRFAARDIYYRLFDAIAVLRYLYPEAFDPNRVIAVDRLASTEVERQVAEMPQWVWVRYEDQILDDGNPVEMLVSHYGHTEHSLDSWRALYEFANTHPELHLRSLEEAYRAV